LAKAIFIIFKHNIHLVGAGGQHIYTVYYRRFQFSDALKLEVQDDFIPLFILAASTPERNLSLASMRNQFQP